MNDYDPLTFPGPTMARSSYHALHSYVVDALMGAPTEYRHAYIDAVGGISSGHMIVAIAEGRARVDIRMEGEQPWLWLSFRHGDAWQPVVAVQGTELGASPSLLIREQELRMDDALAAIWEAEA